jgi:multimeric flavodoxin WrbA
MKIVVLHGSPRKGGNSDTLVNYLLDGLTTSRPHEVSHFYLNEMQIRPCQGCESCFNVLPEFCAVRDDMQAIYRAFIDAQLVVFATPMYWGYMTAQLKAVVDRMEAIAHPRYFKGKSFVVLATYRHHVESTVAFFKRIISYFGGNLHIITCRTVDDATDADKSVSAIPEIINQTFDLGRTLDKAYYSTALKFAVSMSG